MARHDRAVAAPRSRDLPADAFIIAVLHSRKAYKAPVSIDSGAIQPPPPGRGPDTLLSSKPNITVGRVRFLAQSRKIQCMLSTASGQTTVAGSRDVKGP